MAVENGQALSNEVVPTGTSNDVDLSGISAAQSVFSARARRPLRITRQTRDSTDPARWGVARRGARGGVLMPL